MDSLWLIWDDESKADTTRLDALNSIVWEQYLYSQPDSAQIYSELQQDWAERIGNKRLEASALSALAISWAIRGDHFKAADFMEESLKLKEEVGTPSSIAKAHTNLGIMYKNQGDYVRAIREQLQGLVLLEGINDSLGQASANNNLAKLFAQQNNYAKALEFSDKAVNLYTVLDQKKGIGNALHTRGSIYDELGQQENALQNYERAMAIFEELNFSRGIAGTLNNLAIIYQKKEEYQKAIECHKQNIDFHTKMGQKLDLIHSLSNLSGIYIKMGNLSKALHYANLSNDLSLDLGSIDGRMTSTRNLWTVYRAMGRYKDALDMHELHISYKDSINNKQVRLEILNQEYRYEYDKKATADSIKNAEALKLQKALYIAEQAEDKRRLKESELEQAKKDQLNWFLWGGLGLALIFGVFIFNRFRVTRQQRDIIELQKDKVDEAFSQLEIKNEEILSSISYAKRIQNAILPSDKRMSDHLPNSFVLYQPKDIVAGDFYWINRKGDLRLFAACDCTGHGVPGAMVSVICNGGLNRSVNEFDLREPGEILDKTSEIVVAEFEKSDESVKDGMDIALCSLQGTTLKYAGAHNPLWIIRSEGDVVEVYKGELQPIGEFSGARPFTTHTIELEKGDSIYIFSDGFSDQFGGKDGKKFKKVNFMKLLLSIQNYSMKEQKELLSKSFNDWRGDLEQIDDVCVMGVKV